MTLDRNKFEKHINKFKLNKCPICNQKKWIFVDKMFHLPEYVQDPDLMSNYSYPVVPIVCENCGNTLFISAIVAGLVDSLHTK